MLHKTLNRQAKSVCIFVLALLLFCGVCCGISAAADENKITFTFTDGTNTYTQTASADEWFVLKRFSDMPLFTPPEGKMFIGWTDGMGQNYTDKQAVKDNENRVLHPQWAAVKDWDGKSDITEQGYYRLSANTVVPRSLTIDVGHPESGKSDLAVIDLNGKVLVFEDGKSGSVFIVEPLSVVTLTDTSQDAVYYFSPEINQGDSDQTKDIWKLCAGWGAKPADAAPANTIALGDIHKYEDWNNNFKYVTVSGGCITNGTGSPNLCGGGIYLRSNGVFTLNGGYVAGNSAEFGGGLENEGMLTVNGGGIVGNCAVAVSKTGSGGGVYNSGNTVMNGGCIVGNTSKSMGGGFRQGEGEFIIFSGRIEANSAGRGGGGVLVIDGGTFIMNDGSVRGNKAAGYGGGIHNEESTTIINGGTISWNHAFRGGGVDNSQGGKLTINGGDIIHNSAEISAGGVRNGYLGESEEMSHTEIHGGNISYNYSGLWGGGISNVEGKLYIYNGVTITHNTAHEDGGGIDNNDGGHLYIYGGEIAYNKAETGYGGGVNNYSDSRTSYDFPCHTTITGGYIHDNYARWGGGGLYVSYYPEAKPCNLYVSGSPVIKNNASDWLKAADNVYLETWDEAGPGLNNQRYITLVGAMGTGAEVHVSYPLTTGTEKWFFGVVKDGYSATEEDLKHFHADSYLLYAAAAEDGKTLVWKEASKTADSDGTVNFGKKGVNLVVTPDDAGNSPASNAKLMMVTGLNEGDQLTFSGDKDESDHLSKLETAVPAGFTKHNVISIFDVSVTPGGESSSADDTGTKKIMKIQVTVNPGWSPANIRFIHYDTDSEKWESAYLPSSYEKNGVRYDYYVVVESFSPFAVVYAEPVPKTSSSKSQGTSIWLTAEPTATPTPTPTPTTAPEVPQVKPVVTDTPAAKSPVPVAGILAGFGAAFAAAFVCRRK